MPRASIAMLKEVDYRVRGTGMFGNNPEGVEAIRRCGPLPFVRMVA